MIPITFMVPRRYDVYLVNSFESIYDAVFLDVKADIRFNLFWCNAL